MNEITIADDGVVSVDGIILKRLFQQVKKHRGRLFSGCVFYRVEGKMEPFPEFSEIEIQASLEEYPRLIANTTLN